MAKKRFREWVEEKEEFFESEEKFNQRKDEKRYDKKKARIQSARRTKVRDKFSHLD